MACLGRKQNLKRSNGASGNVKPRPEALSLKQLRAFREVADCGSLTAAADALGLSVPAVHAQLRTLRDVMGSDLLVRDEAGGWSLTAEGAVLLVAARSVQTAIDVASARIASMHAGPRGAGGARGRQHRPSISRPTSSRACAASFRGSTSSSRSATAARRSRRSPRGGSTSRSWAGRRASRWWRRRRSGRIRM